MKISFFVANDDDEEMLWKCEGKIRFSREHFILYAYILYSLVDREAVVEISTATITFSKHEKLQCTCVTSENSRKHK